MSGQHSAVEIHLCDPIVNFFSMQNSSVVHKQFQKVAARCVVHFLWHLQKVLKFPDAEFLLSLLYYRNWEFLRAIRVASCQYD